MSLLVVETCVQKSFLCILSPYHHLMKSETSIEQSVRLVFGVTYIVSFLALCSAIDNIFFFDTHIIEPDLKYLYSNKMYCKNPFIDYTARETAVSSVSVDKKNPPNNRFYFLAFLSWLSSLTNDTDVGLTTAQQDQLLFTSVPNTQCDKINEIVCSMDWSSRCCGLK